VSVRRRLPVCEMESRSTVVRADEKQSDDDGEEQHRHDHVPDDEADDRVVARVRVRLGGHWRSVLRQRAVT